MLLNFNIANYRSYLTPASIFFEKRTLKTNHPKDGNWENATHRVTGIFGANASGKSNTLTPITHLQKAIQNSLTTPTTLNTLRDPHALSEPTEPTTFITDYVAGNTRYQWTLALDNNGILEEELAANPNGHWRKIYTRDRNTITFGQKSDIPRRAQENIRELTTPWALTMSAWTTVKTQGEFAEAANWWKTTLLPKENAHHHEGFNTLLDEPTWCHLASIAARSADLDITAVEIDKDANPNTTPKPLRFTHTDGEHHYTLPETAESQGVRAWLDTALPALYAVITGGVYIVDGIDNNLHTGPVRQILDLFSNPALNISGAQLIFTSHDVSLLGNHPRPALHREATWLTEKTNGETQLIALDEFRLRDNNNFEKQYLQGVYGSLPNTTTRELANTIYEFYLRKTRRL